MSAFITSPNLPSPTQFEAAREQIGRIRDKFKTSEAARRGNVATNHANRAIRYSGEEFERDLTQLFHFWLPHCVLSGIPLFSPSSRRTNDSGIEIDNLIHIRHEETNYIIAIEAKAQSIVVEENQWMAQYGEKTKCAKEQVDAHLSALREYLEPISRQIEVKFLGYVVTPDDSIATQELIGKRNSSITLTSLTQLINILDKRFNLRNKTDALPPEVFRVTQSPFLDLLRLSLPLESLGHPELGGALRYVERCRRTLDQTLFNDFNPKEERWLINGSAGMGKSVLLAYTAVVLSCGYRLDGSLDVIGTYKADDFLSIFKYNPRADSMAMIAMSDRQLQNLKTWFDFFVDRFQKTEGGSRLHFHRPDFYLASQILTWSAHRKDYQAVLLDEAHDISDLHENELYKAYLTHNFYLVAACDRFQKLRLTNDSARVLKNFSFSGKSTRLKHVYRNPAPVYIASLALMFRWFAKDGPKVLPKDAELRESYGFDVFPNGNSITLTLSNDAHPANYWSHSISLFPDVETLLNLIRRDRLKREDILWVRFSDENPSFDYEALHQFATYHNCRTRDAHKLCDKYIKGQDFPIVVIEGFPSFMDEFETEDNEKHMWQFRRELYLCTSRATCFLYFVCDVKETDAISRIQDELSVMMAALSNPKFETSQSGSKKWQIRFEKSTQSRDHSVFSQDEIEAEIIASDQTSNPTITIKPEGIEPQASETILTEPQAPVATVTTLPEQLLNSNQAVPHLIEELPDPPLSESILDNSHLDIQYDITIPEPMSTREFSELIGAPMHLVGRELVRIKAYKNSNSPVAVEILAQIAPVFGCRVVDDIADEDLHS